ncbi:MAG: NAD(+) synthase [Selenomonadaceae bacterium]|nr:NAD(+) synthase [Selenomonadaceae bacterium]
MSKPLKIALVQTEVLPGCPRDNADNIIRLMSEAKDKAAELVIFSEMAVPGYLLGDTWESAAFLADCLTQNERIIAATKELGIAVMFGSVAVDPDRRNNDGRLRKYNAFFTAADGALVAPADAPYPFTIKTLLPNYREFDDSRYFFSLRKLAYELNRQPEELLYPLSITLNGEDYLIGRLICEDGWGDDYDFQVADALVNNCYKKYGKAPDIFINISASPFTLGKNQKRHRVFGENSRRHNIPLIYVNHTGIQNNGKTIYTFDGSSTVYDRSGAILAASAPYEEEILYAEYSKSSGEIVAVNRMQPAADTAACESESIYRSLSYGIKHFLQSTGISKVVIGISGGIDSAVTAALYAAVLPPENLLLINMPSRFNSATTKDLARQLADAVGCRYAVAPIEESVELTVQQINSTPICFKGDTAVFTVSDFVRENIQARDRSARVLAGFAAAFGGAFTCNANKAELTVGYSTLYGDQAGFLCALADLWKYQVYDLARYLNREVFHREIVPQGTIDIVPSAELSDAQDVDAGKGDPIIYPYHDYLFRSFIERWDKATPADLLRWYEEDTIDSELGCEAGLTRRLFPTPDKFTEDLERWWKCFSGLGIAKRIQAPPVLAVSRRAYGFDHRESQNGVYFTTEYIERKNKLLSAEYN